MTSEQIFMLIAIAVYLAAMLLIGIWCSKKIRQPVIFI